MIKSGSDFRDFSEIAVDFSNSRRPTFDVVRHTITRDVPPDPDVAALVAKYCDSMEDRMKESIGRFVTLFLCSVSRFQTSIFSIIFSHVE